MLTNRRRTSLGLTRRRPVRVWRPTDKQRRAARMLSRTGVDGSRFILFDGGVRSGKTLALVRWYVNTALQYEGARLLVLRRLQKYARRSVWESFRSYIIEYLPDWDRRVKFREKEMVILFHETGSIIQVDGLDNPSKLENIHGTEWFRIWMNEATQFDLEHCLRLMTRLSQVPLNLNTGRPADGETARKLVMDCNPSTRRHWVYQFCIAGVVPGTNPPRPVPVNARWARLNWSVYDNLANLPEDIIDTLKTLPEVQRLRAMDGRWVTGENLVFPEFDENMNLTGPIASVPSAWEVVCGIDFGYTHPFCHLWCGYDRNTDVLYVFDELYVTERTVGDLSEEIKSRWPSTAVSWRVADHDAEDAATLREHGITTRPALKMNKRGTIEKLRNRLATGRLIVCRNCVNLIDEMYSLQWDRAKDMPKKENDHAIDALLYVVAELDVGRDNAFGSEDVDMFEQVMRDVAV